MRILENLMGSPMAAPESRFMRRLRMVFIGLASGTMGGIAALGSIVGLVGRAGAGALLAALIGATLLVGLIFFIRKHSIDDRWILERRFDREEEGA